MKKKLECEVAKLEEEATHKLEAEVGRIFERYGNNATDLITYASDYEKDLVFRWGYPKAVAEFMELYKVFGPVVFRVAFEKLIYPCVLSDNPNEENEFIVCARACNLKEIQAFRAYVPTTILSNLTNAVTKLINRIAKLFTSFESPQIPEYIEKSRNIQRRMLGILLPDQENYSRLRLRLALDLPPAFKEEPEAIRSLEGAISNITKEKIDVTEIIRNMRDNR